MRYGIPSAVIYGDDAKSTLKELIIQHSVKHVLIITDKSIESLGLVNQVIDQMDFDLITIENGVMPNPKDTYIEEVTSKYKSHLIDGIIAIGGGSVMDAAKAVNVMLCNKGSIDHFENNPILNRGKVLFCIPTTSGTASEVTNVSVITNTKEKRKMVILGDYIKADYAVLLPELTYNMPKHIKASTAMDALTHAMESYISTLATPFTDAHSKEAMRLIINNIEKNTNESKDALMLASTMAGFSFNNAILGLVHAIAHPLGAHFDVPHGVANAMMLPEVMRYNQSSTDKFKGIKEAFACDDPIEFLVELNERLEIPKLKDYINVSDFELIASEAIKEPSLMMNPRSAQKDDIIEILNKSL